MRTHPTGVCPFCKRTSLRLDKEGKLSVHRPTLIMPRRTAGAPPCPGSGQSPAKPPPNQSPAKPPPNGDVFWCVYCDDGGATWNGYAYVHERCVEEARHRKGAQQ